MAPRDRSLYMPVEERSTDNGLDLEVQLTQLILFLPVSLLYLMIVHLQLCLDVDVGDRHLHLLQAGVLFDHLGAHVDLQVVLVLGRLCLVVSWIGIEARVLLAKAIELPRLLEVSLDRLHLAMSERHPINSPLRRVPQCGRLVVVRRAYEIFVSARRSE